MKQRICRAVFLLVIFGLICGNSFAEYLGPGTYHGYLHRDRWGRNVFHLGPYHLFVSDTVAKRLQSHEDKPLELEVSKMSQPRSHGAGMIIEVKRTSVRGEAINLTLSAKVKSPEAKEGTGVSLHFSLQNNSRESTTVYPGSFAVVLVTDSPFKNKDVGYKDPEGRAYWYYSSYGYFPLNNYSKPLIVACREVKLGWNAEDLIKNGRNITVANGYRGKNGWVTLEPGATFESDFAVGKELLPDDYEVFFYMATGNLSSLPGPMSKRITFDVLPKKEKKQSAQPSAPADADKPRR